jgi:aminoglycoside 6'-N-acetyltransferase I
VLVRPLTQTDVAAWVRMRMALWPDAAEPDLRHEAEAYSRGEGLLETVLVAERAGEIVGMVELSLRSYAEGCSTAPVPYVEGWYVDPGARRSGVGRALLAAVERWAYERGHSEIASDAAIDNQASEQAHRALGFEEVERVIHFRKRIGAEAGAAGS